MCACSIPAAPSTRSPNKGARQPSARRGQPPRKQLICSTSSRKHAQLSARHNRRGPADFRPAAPPKARCCAMAATIGGQVRFGRERDAWSAIRVVIFVPAELLAALSGFGAASRLVSVAGGFELKSLQRAPESRLAPPKLGHVPSVNPPVRPLARSWRPASLEGRLARRWPIAAEIGAS